MLTLLSLLVAWSSNEAGARVMLGQQSARYVVTITDDGWRLPAYENNGYRQRVINQDNRQLLDVRVHNGQLASKVPGRVVTDLPAEIRQLQVALNVNADRYLADQVLVLMQWLREEIQYEWESRPGQDVAQVMATRSANCVGMANLAIYVLEHMGVKARYVTGVARRPEDPKEMVLEGPLLHRWIEVYYEDVGWVFCDPAGKVNFVEATYMVLGIEDVHRISEAINGSVGTRVRLVRFDNGMKLVGRFPKVDSRLRIRPNRLYVD